MMVTARLLGLPASVTTAFIVASMFTTMGFYRVWVLADAVAVAMMLVSLWAMVRYRKFNYARQSLIVAACVALLEEV